MNDYRDGSVSPELTHIELKHEARRVIAKCRATGVNPGTGTDLLIDNIPGIRSVEHAREILRDIGFIIQGDS